MTVNGYFTCGKEYFGGVCFILKASQMKFSLKAGENTMVRPFLYLRLLCVSLIILKIKSIIQNTKKGLICYGVFNLGESISLVFHPTLEQTPLTLL